MIPKPHKSNSERGPDKGRHLNRSRRNFLRGFFGQNVSSDQPVAAGTGIDGLARAADRSVGEDDFERGLELFTQLVASEPEHLEALRGKSWCELRLGRFEEARMTLDELAQIDPGSHFPCLYRGLSHALEGNLELALDAWREYKNYQQILIAREINLVLLASDSEQLLEASEVAERVKNAIELQAQKTQ